MVKIIFCKGLPASGKSTWARCNFELYKFLQTL